MDEASDFAKGIANMNSNAIVFTLMPLIHQSTERACVVRHRRDIEDKLMSSLAYCLKCLFFCQGIRSCGSFGDFHRQRTSW